MTDNKKISIVIPVYNEEDNLKLLQEKLTNVLNSFEGGYEIIYVDDCSTDNSFEILKSIKNEHTKIIKFRRNYGQTAAMQAGINNSSGDIIITLDADLQNDPNDIPKLVEKYNQGYDLVSGWRKNRHDNLTRTIPSKIANGLISKITKTGLHDTGCTLKAYNGNILRNINLFADHHRFIPARFLEHSTRIAEVEVEHHSRMYGKSKYNILRVFRVIIDIIAISFWQRYKNKPMYFWGGLALISLLLSFIPFICLFFNLSNTNILLLYLILMVILVVSSFVFIAIGLVFESILKLSLEYYKGQNYTVETIL